MNHARATLKIRKAVPSDADALTDLVFRSKQSNGYDDAFMAACRDELRITPEVLSQRIYWVAEGDGPLGCAALCAADAPDTGEVHAFFIDPVAKRRGVGRALWAVIREAAIGHGWRRLVLDADPAAVAFYEAMGFAVVGRAPSASIPGRFLPHMAIDLSSPPSP